MCYVVACELQIFSCSFKIINLEHHKSDLHIVLKRFCEVVT